jgi:uncharacterized membrane protein YhaH (DUF805 family)
MASETFEQVLAAAQAEGSLTPAWKKFVHTRFFVAIERTAGDDPGRFTLHTNAADGKPGVAIAIAEQRERVAAPAGTTLLALSGVDVVRRLPSGGGIAVALSEGVFDIPGERVEWLRKGIDASLARAADKARQAGAFPTLDAVPVAAPVTAPAAPAPAKPPAPAAPTLAKAPVAPTPVQRNQVGVLDVAALKPRNVTLPKIGLEFFVPGDWTESATTTGLRFSDPQRQSTMEASGFHRPNLSLAQWVEMRLALVRHEMRHLTQDGESYPFEGEGWRGRVKGMVTEFTGTFPGDDVDSRYLVACIWVDGTLASLAIRAPAAVFEQQRALYKWLLGRVEMNQAASTVYSPPGSALSVDTGQWETGETPPMFGFSLEGRIGRMRALAYSFPVMLPLALIGILAAVVAPMRMMFALVVLGIAAVVTMWFSLRLMVLRLHDVNMSGKWLLGFMAFIVLGAILKNAMMVGVLSVIFWVGSAIIYCFVPGTGGDNDYGAPPGPNSTLVNVGAGLFIAFQVLSLLGAFTSAQYASKMGLSGSPGPRARATSAQGTLFTAPDDSFSVMLPGVPQEQPMPPEMLAQLGGIEMRHYQLVANNTVYVVQAIDYGERMAGDRYDIMDQMQQAVLGKDGTLLSARPIVLKGATGREVRVALPDGGMRAARMAVIGSKFCMVTVSAPAGAASAPAVDAVLDSFRLK